MSVSKLKDEYEVLSLEYSKLNTELNRAIRKEVAQDELDTLELKEMRAKRELDAKYQEIVNAQIEGDK